MVYTYKMGRDSLHEGFTSTSRRAAGRQTARLELSSASSSCWSAFRRCDLIIPLLVGVSADWIISSCWILETGLAAAAE